MKARRTDLARAERDVRSLRSYPHIGDLRRMVARSAYSQLRYSPLLLAATISGMALTYLAPPVLALLGGYPANAVAAGAWALMTLAYLPILSFYGLSSCGPSFAADRIGLFGVHLGFSVPALAGQGWGMEGPQSGLVSEAMTHYRLDRSEQDRAWREFSRRLAFDCGCGSERRS